MRPPSPIGSASTASDVSIEKFRSVEEMPPTWRAKDDPANLRITLFLLALGRRLAAASGSPTPVKGVTRFRSLREAQDAEAPPPPCTKTD